MTYLSRLHPQLRYQWAAVGIILLATLIRLPWLATQSIAFDESFSLMVSRLNLSTLFQAILSDGVHPPLFYILYKTILPLWGESEFGQRFFAAVFSIVAVALCYKLGKLLFSPIVGLIGALLLAVNPLHVWFAQEARMYSLLGALTLVSMLVFWQALHTRQFKYWAVLAVTNSLIFLLHYFGLLVPIIQFIFILTTFSRNHNNLRPWAFSQAAASLPLLPWLIATALRDAQNFGIGFLDQPNLLDIPLTFLNLAIGSSSFLGMGTIVAVVVMILTLTLAFRRLPPHKVWLKHARLLMLLWFIVPPFLTWLISQRRSFYADRYLSFAIPGLVLLLAFGASRVQKTQWRSLLVVGLVLVSGVGLWATRLDPVFQKDNWRAVATYIAGHQESQDVILLYTTHIKFPFDYYYHGSVPQKSLSLNLEQFPIEPFITDHQRAWVIYPYTRRPTHYPMQPLMPNGYWHNDPERNLNLVTWLETQADNIVDYQHFSGIEMWLINMERDAQ